MVGDWTSNYVKLPRHFESLRQLAIGFWQFPEDSWTQLAMRLHILPQRSHWPMKCVHPSWACRGQNHSLWALWPFLGQRRQSEAADLGRDPRGLKSGRVWSNKFKRLPSNFTTFLKQSQLFLYATSPRRLPVRWFCIRVLTKSMGYTAVAPVAPAKEPKTKR